MDAARLATLNAATALARSDYQSGGTAGDYKCNGPAGYWDNYSSQAYAILVLQRSVGGGCIDGDEDGIYDAEDNCPVNPNPGQEDGNGDALLTAVDQSGNLSDPVSCLGLQPVNFTKAGRSALNAKEAPTRGASRVQSNQ